jgi:hypothetical protein
MYVGEMLMGPEFTPMEVVFDTGSDWLVVEGDSCYNCEGNTFNETSGVKLSSEKTERLYGSAALEGFEYTDLVCITP